MVGINLNGVVHGRELRSIAGEIFNKAKSHNPSAKADTSQKNINENPFKSFNSGLVEFVPEETKIAKAGFEQNTLQIDQGIQKTVNSQAAIDNYSRFAMKYPSDKLGEELFGKVSEGGIEINSATKDRAGKNPFAFLAHLPKNQKEALNEEQLRSIFDAIANKNQI
jgi:hypothetical protein